MKYISTRGGGEPLSFSEAVQEGLAPDGGLYVPAEFPDLSAKMESWQGLSYAELCFEFMRVFADDIPEAHLRSIIDASYTRFDDARIAPLKKLGEDLFILELFHGPTLAFKDFALQFLGNLSEYLLARRGGVSNVLGATSGDTGSAAINGLLGKKGVRIFILYPDGRISPLQERQMACTGADNVFPMAISGTFDDAQAIVKEIFADVAFKSDWNLAAVNSINLARIMAQCVYYIYAWLQIPEQKRSSVQFIVPTGNFGNVLAGWFASKTGMKVAGFKVATNQNDILYRLFNTGVYEVSAVRPSVAPSMDIQVSSNFERFLYFVSGGDCAKVREIMGQFKATGKYVFENFGAEGFSASKMDDAQIARTIADIYARFGEIIDPHTACGFADTSHEGVKIVLSTASPAKFPDLIEKTIGVLPTARSLQALLSKKIVNKKMAADTSLVRAYIESNGIRQNG